MNKASIIILSALTALVQLVGTNVYGQADKVTIDIGNGYPFEITELKYNQIKKDHPEFFSKKIESPEILWRKFSEKQNDPSLTNKDSYFVYYAHFFQLKNVNPHHISARKKAIQNYLIINDIGRGLKQGGTYFGHEVTRIPAFAEFNLLEILEGKVEDVSKNEFDYRKMKIIGSIKYQIQNREPLEYGTDIKEWNSEHLLNILGDLENSITSVIDLILVEMYI